MEQNIDKLVGLFLQAEEMEESIEVIIDSEIAYEIATKLYDELDKNFETEEDNEFENLLIEEDILGVSMYMLNGESVYFLEPVFNDKGITLYGESDKYFIHEDVIDIIDTDRLYGEIIIIEEEIETETDIADELEEVFDDISNDLVDEISECIDEEDYCVHCAIKERLSEVYLIGYKKAQEMMRDALTENLENME